VTMNEATRRRIPILCSPKHVCVRLRWNHIAEYVLQPNILSVLFVGFACISYWRFIAVRYELNTQRNSRTVGEVGG
jgi:hypothetical protein